jgi:hypothetical protein
LSDTALQLIKSYREQAKDEFEHHKKFVAMYYVAKLLVAGVGFGFIYKSSGFFSAPIVCIAIAALTSAACFLFSLRTLRASEARYRPLLRFNAKLCSAGGVVLAVITLVLAAASLDRTPELDRVPTQWLPAVSRLDDVHRMAGPAATAGNG